MSSLPDLGSQLSAARLPATAYLEFVAGAAVFDLNGLPNEYLTTADLADMSWVQTIFQALGLQHLLTTSLQLDQFNHATMWGPDYCAVVVKQHSQYIALLIHLQDIAAINALIEWSTTCSLADLKNSPRFRKG